MASRKTLAEKIAQEFADSAPVFQDPDDDLDDLTSATVVYNHENDDDELEINTGPSSLRISSAPLLADEDEKYAGKVVSRKSLSAWSDDEDDNEKGLDDAIGRTYKDLYDLEFVDAEGNPVPSGTADLGDSDEYDEDDEGDGDEDDDDDDDDMDGNDHDVDLSRFAKPMDQSGTRKRKRMDDEDDDDDDDDDDDEDNDDEEEDKSKHKGENEGVMKTFSSSVRPEVHKGLCVKNQIEIWEILLELRIELQKLLNIANQLPQHDVFNQLSSVNIQGNTAADHMRLSVDELSLVTDSCHRLCGEFLTLQKTMEGCDAEHDLDEDEDLTSTITKRFETSQNKRIETIQFWDEKTRLSTVSGKTNALSTAPQPALQLIQQVLADKSRLLSRAQLRYKNMNIIGKPLPTEEVKVVEADGTEEVVPTDKIKQHYDAEIFNDDDFYHQLLRELIEQRTSRSNDPKAISRQWLEFQNLKKKAKLSIAPVIHNHSDKHLRMDSSILLSQTLSIRPLDQEVYTVIPKLRNFMAPVLNANEWDDERKDDLFSSLFGAKMQAVLENKTVVTKPLTYTRESLGINIL